MELALDLPTLFADEEQPVVQEAASQAFNLQVGRDSFLRILSHMLPVIERRNTIPVLANVLLDCTNGDLQVTATDLEMLVTESANAEIASAGKLTVSAQILYEIVRKLPEGKIQLTYKQDSQMLEVRQGQSLFSLPTLPANSFPLMDAGELSFKLVLTSSALLHLLNSTSYAMSTEETRYYLNGVHVQPLEQAGQLFWAATATDGHRLAQSLSPAPVGLIKEVQDIILPKKLVHELGKLLDDIAGEVIVAFSKSKIECTLGSVRLLSKLIDATFPDCQAVIPSSWASEISLPRKALIERLDRIAIVAQEKTKGIKLYLKDGLLLVSASGDAQGSGNESLPVDYHGPELDMAFSVRYLLEALQAFTGDSVLCQIVDAYAPITLRDEGELTALAVVMPMRI